MKSSFSTTDFQNSEAMSRSRVKDRKGQILWASLLAAMFIAGCDGEAPTAPTAADVAGVYTASRLEIAHDGQWVDALELGGEIVVNLHEDGTLAGRQFLPAALSGDPGGDGVDLEGTWSFYYSLVELEPTATPTLVDGVRFTLGPALLDGRYPTQVTERLRITLSRGAD